MSTAAPTPVTNDDERHYRIGQVSRLTGVAPFVLRYWEDEIPLLQPAKSLTGYRMYTRRDLNLIFKIKKLLYEQGFTIAGARRHLEDLGEAAYEGDAPAADQPSVTASAQEPTAKVNRKTLLELRDTLRGFLTLLERK
jgi:DNA-binding transcriptional MerR regulator